MRIISGLNGGQTIKVPKNFKLRPTTDQSKEGIFNIISNYYDVDKLEVLDLFSGTGNISYEFASRGAKYVRAVEINFKHYNFIRSENRRMNLNIDVIKSDVFKYLNIKSNGVFLEIKDNTTSRFNYKEKENTLQIEMENGNIKEESFYMSGDTLIIQSISDGNVKKNKFIKESLVL